MIDFEFIKNMLQQFYINDIAKIKFGIDKETDKIIMCENEDVECIDCKFSYDCSKDCEEQRRDWLLEEYKG